MVAMLYPLMFIVFAPWRWSGELLAQPLLVDLPNTRSCECIDELHDLRHRVFRYLPGCTERQYVLLDVVFRDHRALLEHNQRHRSLPPLLILDADDGHFGNALVLRDQVFYFERRNPLAAGLDHVLETIGDLYVARRIDMGNVLRMEIAAGPKLLGSLGIVQVALREPWCARDYLAGGAAVVDENVRVLVHDTQVNERNRPAGLAAQAKLLAGIELFRPGRKLRETEYG